jgi:hypothetical protein
VDRRLADENLNVVTDRFTNREGTERIVKPTFTIREPSSPIAALTQLSAGAKRRMSGSNRTSLQRGVAPAAFGLLRGDRQHGHEPRSRRHCGKRSASKTFA